MRFVHSYWFKPFVDLYGSRFNGGFPTERLFWYSWVISYMCISRKYSEFCLYTDNFGIQRIVREIGLSYAEVHDDLEKLPKPEADFWNYGKFATYLLQQSPFVQIDVDAYLWRRIPEALLDAPLLLQEIERRPSQKQFYQQMLAVMRESVPGLSQSMLEISPPYSDVEAWNCGIFGGANLALIHTYARECMAIIDNPENLGGWRRIAAEEHGLVNIGNCGIAIEQLTIRGSAKEHDVVPKFFIENPDEGEQAMFKAGLTHLVGAAKGEVKFHQMLEGRMQKDFPDLKSRIDALCSE